MVKHSSSSRGRFQNQSSQAVESLEQRRMLSARQESLTKSQLQPSCVCKTCPFCGGAQAVSVHELAETRVIPLKLDHDSKRRFQSTVQSQTDLSKVFGSLDKIPAAGDGQVRSVFPTQAVPFTASLDVVRRTLAAAPLDPLAVRYNLVEDIRPVSGVNARPDAKPVAFALPSPDGSFARFNVWRSQVMHPELEANSGGFTSYIGQGIDDPSASLAMSVSNLGIQASVYTPNGQWYIDPTYQTSTDSYIAYKRQNLQRVKGFDDFICNTNHGDAGGHTSLLRGGGGSGVMLDGGGAITLGSNLRVYDLAVTTTGEWSSQFGGNAINALNGVAQTVVRLNQVYERDLAVRLQLVPNNNLLIYTNAAADPFTTPNDGTSTFTPNQTNTDAIIGSANYDIGHVYHLGSGGVATLNSVGVNGIKARGYTAGSGIADPFTIDYVAHEIGHQFGGRHNFSSADGAPGDSASLAVEPGSGQTIMGYAGLGTAAEDILNNSIPMFSSISIEQMNVHVTGTAAAAATLVPTANAAPLVNVPGGPTFTIPARTPFRLTASASDPNGDSLTYSWEQRNGNGPNSASGPGGITGVPSPNNTFGPTFRVFPPSSSPTRLFPRLSSILAGGTGASTTSTPSGEQLPFVSRTMNFTVNVRDNRAGLQDASVTVSTLANTTPFQFTNFNTASTVVKGTPFNLNWDVSNTVSSAAINATLVNIRLSTDGGNTFPIELASSVPNDGSESVIIPTSVPNTSTARFLIEPTNNIFFDINNANITLANPAVSPVPSAPALTAATDTGISNSDLLTRNNNSSPGTRLAFTVSNTVAGATIELLLGTTVIGTAAGVAGSTTVLTNATVTLPDGPNTITARQTQPSASPSVSSTGQTITVDSVAPVSTQVPFDRNIGPNHQIAINVSEPVFNKSLTTLQVNNAGPGVSPGNATALNDNITQLVYQFTGQFDRGNYTATFANTAVTDAAGNSVIGSSQNFRFQPGDANNDGVTDFADLVILSRNFNLSPRSFTQGDFNYSGNVDFADLVILSRNFNRSIILPPTITSIPSARPGGLLDSDRPTGDVLA